MREWAKANVCICFFFVKKNFLWTNEGDRFEREISKEVSRKRFKVNRSLTNKTQNKKRLFHLVIEWLCIWQGCVCRLAMILYWCFFCIASLAIFQCYLSNWWVCTLHTHMRSMTDSGWEMDIKKRSFVCYKSAQMPFVHNELPRAVASG